MWGNYDIAPTQWKDLHLIYITSILFLPKKTHELVVFGSDGAATALICHVALPVSQMSFLLAD